MDFNFTANGNDFTAIDAGWAKNGEQVWDIADSNEEFVGQVTVHPFDHISVVTAKWSEMEACYA